MTQFRSTLTLGLRLDPFRRQQLQRRTSRLEMGIPIEEVFSRIQFATIEKPTSSHSVDDVITEEPDISESEHQPGSSSNDAGLTSDDSNFNHHGNISNCSTLEEISEDLT